MDVCIFETKETAAFYLFVGFSTQKKGEFYFILLYVNRQAIIKMIKFCRFTNRHKKWKNKMSCIIFGITNTRITEQYNTIQRRITKFCYRQ